METKSVHAIFFSPAYTTKKITKAIANGISANVICHDITQGNETPIILSDNELAVIGVPVFSGRIPSLAAQYLAKMQAKATPAIIVCIYGNREYDDALLELKNVVTQCGFVVISAGAFIARHSIFPEIAKDRPDANDFLLASEFGKKSVYIFPKKGETELNIKGNFPYKEAGAIPLTPKGNSKCNKCGTCVLYCPVNAIDKDTPRKTNKHKCISCARCIEVCPKKARAFKGLIYKIVAKKFKKNYSGRREIELFFPK